MAELYKGTYYKDGKAMALATTASQVTDENMASTQEEINQKHTSALEDISTNCVRYVVTGTDDNVPKFPTSEINDDTTSLSYTWSSAKLLRIIKALIKAIEDLGGTVDLPDL